MKHNKISFFYIIITPNHLIWADKQDSDLTMNTSILTNPWGRVKTLWYDHQRCVLLDFPQNCESSVQIMFINGTILKRFFSNPHQVKTNLCRSCWQHLIVALQICTSIVIRFQSMEGNGKWNLNENTSVFEGSEEENT